MIRNPKLARNIKALRERCRCCEYSDLKQPNGADSCLICFRRKGNDGKPLQVPENAVCDHFSRRVGA